MLSFQKNKRKEGKEDGGRKEGREERGREGGRNERRKEGKRGWKGGRKERLQLCEQHSLFYSSRNSKSKTKTLHIGLQHPLLAYGGGLLFKPLFSLFPYFPEISVCLNVLLGQHLGVLRGCYCLMAHLTDLVLN